MGLLLVSEPLAAAPSFNAQNLKQSADNGYYLGVTGSQPLPKGKFSLGLHTDFAHEPIILVNAAGAKLQNIIGKAIAASLYGAYGLLPWWDVGLQVTALPYLRFQAAGAAAETRRTEMGDIQLVTRFRLLDNQRYPVGLAVVPFVTFPTGQDATFSGDGGLTGGANAVLESKRAADRFSVALNVGAELREQAQLTSGTTMDDRLLYGFGANLAVHRKVDLIGELRGFTLLSDLFGSRQRPLEFDGAVRFYAHRNIATTIGGGVGLLDGVGNPVGRAFLGLAYVPEHKEFVRKKIERIEKVEEAVDTDGDGLTDDRDRCPTEAGPVENDGCPAVPKVVIVPEDFRILTRPIHFDFAKATLRPDARPILEALAEALKARPSIQQLSIEGHCDYIGTEGINYWLSVERAKAVKKFLVREGIEEARLQAIGHGEKVPVDFGKTPAARAKNRRVEFIFLEVEGMEIPEPVPPTKEPTLPETNPEANPDLNPANSQTEGE